MKQNSLSLTHLYIRYPVCLLLGGVMFLFLFAMQPLSELTAADNTAAALLFAALYTLVTAALATDRRAGNIPLLFVSAGTAALIVIRVALLSHDAPDYYNFLGGWLEQMRELSVREAMTEKIGDYNMPYLYFLLAVSRSSINSQLLIKWFSCCFDFIAAYFVMKTVSLKTENRLACHLGFLLSLSLPTVLLNSAYLAQCDSILAALCCATLYFSLKGDGIKATVAYALAFSVKLQAIFILPVVIVCFIAKKFKLWHAALFPVTFFATLLPAIFAGRSIVDCIRIYFDQASQYPRLTLSAPNIWQLFGDVDFEPFNMFGIMLAGLAAAVLLYICYVYRDGFDRQAVVELCYISAAVLPFLLPRMHERYFYLADIFSVALFFYDRRRWYVPLITVLASFNAYFCFLGGNKFNPAWTAAALLVVISITVKSFVERIKTNEPERTAD